MTKKKTAEPPEVMDGLPLAAWRALLAATDDPARLRAVALEIAGHLEALHAEATAQGVKLPRWVQPSVELRRAHPKKGGRVT